MSLWGLIYGNGKSIYVNHPINGVKEKNGMIILTDTEKYLISFDPNLWLKTPKNKE